MNPQAVNPGGDTREKLPICERWLPVPGYEGRYEVSDLGNVRSLPRQRTRGGVLSQIERYGYLSVCLSGRMFSVHRLVLLAHVGPCPKGMETAHCNGNRKDNRLSNLRWATKSENTADRAAHGKYRRAMDARRALTPAQAQFVCANHGRIKQTEMAAMLGVARTTVQRALSRARNGGQP
jgi:hypothetical protein